MRTTSDRILLAVSNPDDPLLLKLTEIAHADRSFLVVHHPETEKLTDRINALGRCALLFVISSSQQVKSLVHSFRNELAPYIQGNDIIPIALNRLRHHNVPRILKKMGFAEIISASSIKPSSLKIRIDEIFQRTHPSPSFVVTARKTERSKTSGALVVRECRLEVLEPLAIESDCWLLRNPQDIRIVNDQWIIDLIGPGPSAGRWTRMQSVPLNPSDGHSLWEWKPRKGSGLFVPSGGSWIFQGKRPRFDEFHWTFTGKDPRLTYFEGTQPVCDYLRVGANRVLHLAANSEVAKKKWPAIQASVLNDYHYSVAKENKDTAETWRFEQEVEGKSWRQLMDVPTEAKPTKLPSKEEIVKKINTSWAPGKKLFNPIAMTEERINMVREMVDCHCSALVWTHGQKIRFPARLRGAEDQYNSVTLELPSDLSANELVETLHEQEESRLYVNISLRRGSVFFATSRDAVSVESNFLRVIVPEEIYQVQRRTHFRRVFASEEKPFFVRIGSRFHRVLNLSGGGMAFAADLDEQALYMPGTHIIKMSFGVYNETVNCKAIVRWTSTSDDAPVGEQLMVGVQFERLKPADQQKINLYVLEEGFEYFRKYVLGT